MTLQLLPDLQYAKPLNPARDLGAPGELRWIALSQLRIDPTYQRQVGEAGQSVIRRIVENFSWRKFSPLIVAPRDGGLFAVIDGQHRATAAKHHKGIERVPCFVLKCWPSEEADAFAVINGSITRVHSQAMFKAKLAAADPKALAAQKAAEAAGVRILPYPVAANAIKPNETLSCGKIENCVALYGHDVTAAALGAIVRAAKGAPGMLRAGVIQAFCMTFHNNAAWLKRVPEAADAIAAHGLPALMDEVARAAKLGGGNSIAAQLVPRLTAIIQRKLGPSAVAKPAAQPGGAASPAPRRVADRPVRREKIANPGLKPDERAMIDEFVAKKGVRKVEPAATGDRYHLLQWLQRRGIKIEYAGRKAHELRWRMGERILDVKKFDALVDRERAKDGLEPLRRAAA